MAEQATHEVNQQYVITTFDLGVCRKAFPLVWSHPQRYANHIILRGTFHLSCANLKMVGTKTRGSGMTDWGSKGQQLLVVCPYSPPHEQLFLSATEVKTLLDLLISIPGKRWCITSRIQGIAGKRSNKCCQVLIPGSRSMWCRQDDGGNLHVSC